MAPTYSNGQEMVSIYLIKIKITTKFFKLGRVSCDKSPSVDSTPKKKRSDAF